MASKPAQTPEWASDGTNNTEPLLIQKQSGWTPGQDGVSSYDNWYKELVWQWLEYLSDGALVGNITIEGDLFVDGELTVTGNALIDDDLTVGDDATIGGTLTAVEKIRSGEVVTRWQSPQVGASASTGTLSSNHPGIAPGTLQQYLASSNAITWHTMPTKKGDRFKAIMVAGDDGASVAPTFAVCFLRPEQSSTSDFFDGAYVTATRSGAAIGPFIYEITVDGMADADLTDTLVQLRVEWGPSGGTGTVVTHVGLKVDELGAM